MVDFHYPVIDALEQHDPEAAAAAINQDILRGGEAILERVRQTETRQAGDANDEAPWRRGSPSLEGQHPAPGKTRARAGRIG